MRSHQKMFNAGLPLTPCNRQKLRFFPLITAFLCLCERCWDTELKALLPFLLLFACSSTSPGKVTRGKPFNSLQFFDCEIQQKHNENHAGLLRAMAISGIA